MSGIAGVWNRGGRPVTPDVVTAAAAALRHRGPDGSFTWMCGPVGLACCLQRMAASDESQPTLGPSGMAAVFDGRLDGREELVGSLRGVGLDSPDCAIALAAYATHGDSFTQRLRGDFALAIWDPRRPQLLLARDAIGVKPLHYCASADAFFFGSEIKSLLAAARLSAVPNAEALADLLIGRGAGAANGQTFFKGIFTVPPAHVAVVSPEGVTVCRYWDFDLGQRIRLRSFDDYAAAFAEHFAKAVGRRLRTSRPVAVSLSGGLDSSSIFCVGQTQSVQQAAIQRPLGLSHLAPEGTTADERQFLGDIEAKYDVVVDRIPNDWPRVVDHAREELWHVEAPQLDGLGNRLHGLLRAVRARGCRRLLGGQWGDQVLCERTYLVDLARRGRWLTVWQHLREYPRWHVDVESPPFVREFARHLLRWHAPDGLVTLRRRVRSAISRSDRSRPYSAEFSRLAVRGAGPSAPRGASAHGWSLYREVRNSYHVLCMESSDKAAAMYGLEMAFPFLDRDLLQYLMAVPGEMQTWRGVPKAFLRFGLRGVVPESILARRWKADFTSLLTSAIECERNAIVDLLQEQRLAVRMGLVSGDFASAPPTARISPTDALQAWGLHERLSLELWLQAFCENGEHLWDTARSAVVQRKPGRHAARTSRRR